MEYQYSDIEAHIRQAQKLRSEALGEILTAGWNTCVALFKGFAQRRLHKNIVATKASAAAIY
ncbi:MAG: hypothetical protein CVU24_05275 [Betaproteobacteria bacterium HGW-Betaproteobacteria-18]|nr:MAG: hypothetical protein CVU24_05275 [Betaproteobacteria bacterium HGW-Betaproteobacteria-18]